MTAKVKRVKKVGVETADGPIVNGWLVGGAVAGLLLLAFLLSLALREPEIVTITGYCRDFPDHCLAVGPADAPITFIEVADYACRSCLLFYVETAPYLDEWYLQQGYMRWMFVPHANAAQPETAAAAEAAFCAAEQDNFFDYHVKAVGLFAGGLGLNDVGFLDSARQAGMDIGELTRCLDSDKYVPFVEANTAAVAKAGLQTIPTFYVNEFQIEGVQSYPVFQQRMDRLID